MKSLVTIGETSAHQDSRTHSTLRSYLVKIRCNSKSEIITTRRSIMSTAKWEITDEATLKQGRVDQFGQEEYNRRMKIVEEKRNEFPEESFAERSVVGSQFDSIAFAVEKDVFDKLATKDYRFWSNLFYMLAKS